MRPLRISSYIIIAIASVVTFVILREISHFFGLYDFSEFGPLGYFFYILVFVFVAFIIFRRYGTTTHRQVQHPPVTTNMSNANQSEHKICPFCGEEIMSVAVKCKHCGSFLAAKGSVAQDSIVDGTLGLVSLISGIVGFFIGILLVHLGILLGLTAVVCGVLGLNKGQKYSLPGIVIGIVAILFSLIYSYVSMTRFPPLIL